MKMSAMSVVPSRRSPITDRQFFLATVLLLPLAVTDIAPTGTLRASFIGNNPVQGRVAPTGETTGPCPDLVREFGQRLGVPVVVTPLADAGAVMESVLAGSSDIGCLAIEIARATKVDFSDPYLLMGSTYAVRVDSPIRTVADVDRVGVTVGGVAGQSPVIWVGENLEAARLRTFTTVPSNAELGALLTGGGLDAFAANRTRMVELARDVPGLRVLPDNYMVTEQAFAVPRGNRARLAEVNRLLAEARASGFIKTSIDRANIPGADVAPAPTR
jgi:polar amino acid transport system substrate-binding protein